MDREIRILHTADTHLGYRQYHSEVRRKDFFEAFGETYRITRILKIQLITVVNRFYIPEGFNNQDDFMRTWNDIHPKRGILFHYEPNGLKVIDDIDRGNWYLHCFLNTQNPYHKHYGLDDISWSSRCIICDVLNKR